MGRPKKALTTKQVAQVEALAGVLTQAQIADYFGMSERTLRQRLMDDPEVAAAYQMGRAKTIQDVATNLVMQAKEGNMTAAIFYLKTQAGWKEVSAHEHTMIPVDLSQLTAEQRRALLDTVEPSGAP